MVLLDFTGGIGLAFQLMFQILLCGGDFITSIKVFIFQEKNVVFKNNYMKKFNLLFQ